MSHFTAVLLYAIWPIFIIVAFYIVKYLTKKRGEIN